MRTYYRGTDAVVTDGHFVWLRNPVQPVPIRDLRNIRLALSDAPRGNPRPMQVVFGALVVAGAGWTTLGTPAVYVSAPVCLALAGISTLAYWRRRPQRWELLADHRGIDVTLYANSDTRVFNQVVRALRRAVEDSRPAADGYHLVTA